MLNDGDRVKFAIMSASQYAELEQKDDATVYFITSEFEQRVAVGNNLFANYVPAHCTALSLSTNSDEMTIGDTMMLIAYTEPANPSDPITFTASNNNVTISPAASSNRVLLTANSVGECVITCVCGEFSATCTISVHAAYQYVEHIVVENYNPNGVKFLYTIPSISLASGDYIEISIDLSTVTGTKENILSIGQNIDVWQGAGTGSRIHNYVTASAKQTISVDIIKDTKTRRPTYASPSTDYVVLINKRGVYLNNELFEFDNNLRANPTLTYEEGIAAFLALTSFDVGSQEGANRSHATYNYIKYYTVEEV